MAAARQGQRGRTARRPTADDGNIEWRFCFCAIKRGCQGGLYFPFRFDSTYRSPFWTTKPSRCHFLIMSSGLFTMFLVHAN